MPVKGEGDDPRISIRVRRELLDAFDEWCERNEVSRSAALRGFMRAKTQGELPTDGLVPPDDEELAVAYRRLCEASGPDGVLPTDAALSVIAEATGTPKATVKEAVLEPLEERGYARPKRWGSVEVSK